MFRYVDTKSCEHQFEDKCEPAIETKCRSKKKKECKDEYKDECKTHYRDVCHVEKKKVCKTEFKEVCKPVYRPPTYQTAAYHGKQCDKVIYSMLIMMLRLFPPGSRGEVRAC